MTTLKLLLQVGAHKVDQIFSELGCQRGVSIFQQVQPYMVFEHLGHQTIDSAARRCEQHQHISTVMGFR